MEQHRVVPREEWLAARTALLAREKDLTRARDAVMEERRALPWVRVEKAYCFDGARGRVGLGALFAGRSQLIVNHFMMGPGWREGCAGCSFAADHIDPALVHLAQRDVSLVAVSRAPFAEIAAFRRRMGWRFDWVSSFGSDFNYDFGVSFRRDGLAKGRVFYNYAWHEMQVEELSGFSVFHREATGAIFHTYSSYARGGEEVIGTYALLDMVPKGRDETGPGGDMTDWVRHRDRYGAAREASPCCTQAAE